MSYTTKLYNEVIKGRTPLGAAVTIAEDADAEVHSLKQRIARLEDELERALNHVRNPCIRGSILDVLENK